MKQLLSLLLIMSLGTISVSAQTTNSKIVPTSMKSTWGASSPTGVTSDTIATDTTKYLYTALINGVKKILNIVVTATELSGTTSGTLSVEGSVDGTSWYDVYNSADSTFSYTMLDQAGAQVYRWKIENASDKYYRVKAAGDGNWKYTAKYSAPSFVTY